MLKNILASSQLPLKEAAHDIAEKIHYELLNLPANQQIKLTGLLFSSHPLDQIAHQAFLDTLLSEFPELQLVGCSISAEANSTQPRLSNHQITLSLFITDNKVTISAGLVPSLKGTADQIIDCVKHSFQTTQTTQTNKPRLCLLFPALFLDLSDPEQTALPMKSILAGIAQANLYKRCKILGVVANAPESLETTSQPKRYHSLQFFNQHIFTEAMPYLLFSGAVHLQTTYSNPVQAFHTEEQWLPAKIKHNQLLSVDNLTAAEYLSKTPFNSDTPANQDDSNHYALILKKSQTPLNEPLLQNSHNHYLLNTVDETDKAALKLGYSNPYQILKSSRAALEDLNTFKFKPCFFLGFSDMRRVNCLNSKQSIESEFDLLENQLSTLTDEALPSIIVYGFAEIGYPFVHSKSSSLNCMVMVGLLIGEKAPATCLSNTVPSPMSPAKVNEFSVMVAPALLDLLQDRAILNQLYFKEKITKATIAELLHEKLLARSTQIEHNVSYERLLTQLYKLNAVEKNNSAYKK